MADAEPIQPNEKKCPFCGEKIRQEAIKCRFCGEFLKTAEPAGAQVKGLPGVGGWLGGPVDEGREPLFEGPVSALVLFRPTVILVFWLAVSVAAYAVGRKLAPEAEGGGGIPLLAAAVIALVALLYWLYRWLDFKSTIYRVTRERIEYEHGVLARSIVNTDLWRIQDIRFSQSLLQRILGLGDVVVTSSDKDTPLIRLGPIRRSRSVYDTLKSAYLEADRRRGVVHVEP